MEVVLPPKFPPQVKSYLWRTILIFGLIVNSVSLKATHIIGGDFSYECLGEGNYRFVMKMYRNCNSLAQGVFSNPAPIAIYVEEGDNSYTLFRNRQINIEDSNPPEIPFPDLPCLVPPDDVCAQEGLYIFEQTLPVIDESYHIIFQRCCRNSTINNILTPGDVGATFTIELTPEAQALCNSSPIFNTFPPIIICANEEMSIDQSASDSDGDQLVYEFCTPIKGGGKVGTPEQPGDPSSCDGFRPDPACPPPFDPVDFVVPTYSASQPMGGEPIVSINPNTGEITGIPNVIGQFVVGVCVKEFRNGILLSTTRRDFQFNVEQCDPLIEPVVEADEILEDNTFVINSCGESQIEITNQSNLIENINDFLWTFDINGDEETFEVWDPTLMLPDTGTYEGYLYLNPGTECGDTGRVLVNYYPNPIADFVVQYDTCIAGDVEFFDASLEQGVPITSHLWILGNGMSSMELNPVVDFEEPGSYFVQLTIVDEHQCADNTQQVVDWFPAPELIIIEPSSFVGCPPADIFFNNLTEPIDETYEINWQFGDGLSSEVISPTHVYDSTGSYSIDVAITSPLGCLTAQNFPNWINITPEPIANFDYTPEELDNFNPTVEFIDSSLYADSWYWSFDEESDSYIQNPTYTFRDTGFQIIELIVTHPNGCADTLVKTLDIVPMVRYYLPNAFTPNGDGTNDLFLGNGYLVGIDDFNLEIWNRWGEQIFQTNDPKEGWNGTKFNTGELSPNGVYQCFVHFVDPRGKDFDYEIPVTLLR